MLMAARKLQGIGLVLLVLIFAMMLYPVSLKVAATRSELTRIERQIDRTRDNIRYLESELAVRASMRQLEQWNADTFGYSAPDAGQYLANERQLASLDRLPRARGANEVAPVLMAMVSPVGAPAASTEAAPKSAPATKPAAKPVVLAQAETAVRSDVTPRMAPTRRREQLKMIEDQLLAESTLADLKRAAAAEAAGGKSAR
jgi:Na+-transporting methylmalonyl-CoA/oxaloacetate decarboxylase gamma subunit